MTQSGTSVIVFGCVSAQPRLMVHFVQSSGHLMRRSRPARAVDGKARMKSLTPEQRSAPRKKGCRAVEEEARGEGGSEKWTKRNWVEPLTGSSQW